LDYKFKLPKYDINNSRFVGLEICSRTMGFMSCAWNALYDETAAC